MLLFAAAAALDMFRARGIFRCCRQVGPRKGKERTVSTLARSRTASVLVWVLFLCSGACGLIYEVLWTRQLGLIFGNTAHSLAAVLAAFMGGLALGSYTAGRLCHRLARPFLAYGVLEVLIGLYCAALPWALSDAGPIVPVYRALYGEQGGGAGLAVVRFAISFVLLLIPTTLMGATLPVLTHFLVRSKQALGRTAGRLYAVNALGAVAGALAAGFVLLPGAGKAGTNWIAVAGNLTLGLLAVAAGAAQRVEAGKTGTDAILDGQNGVCPRFPVSAWGVKAAAWAFGVTGFAAMATQIGWTRALSLGTGSSTYAFSLIVAVFILGLSFGGWWGARAAGRSGDPLALLARVLLLIGLAGFVVSAALGFCPYLFLVLLAWGQQASWGMILLLEGLGIALLILPPTFLMGATMPLTMQVAAHSAHPAGRTVGTLYAINTLGAILGSLFGGLLLIPWLQIQSTLEMMALCYAIPGLLLFVLSASRRRPSAAAGVGLICAPLVALSAWVTPWNPQVMNAGLYLLRNPGRTQAARAGDFATAFHRDADEVLYYREGAESTVAVTRLGDEISLRVGGKPDASLRGDLSTQVNSGVVPVLLHAQGPRDALVIGLGSGVSAGSLLGQETLERVDVVEISPEVVEASWHFRSRSGLTYREQPAVWLDTPKVNVIINDGRNHLLLTPRRYDVITCEPSNPWMAGIGNLFTREAFELARLRLKPGGIMCQWLHTYRLERAHFLSVVQTFTDVFPHTQLWCVNVGVDFLLLGSDRPLSLPVARLRERLKQSGIRQALGRIAMDDECEFLACFIMDDASLRRLAAKAELHTDDRMQLEFAAPKALYIRTEGLSSALLAAEPESALDLTGLTPGERAEFLGRLDLAVSAREHARCAMDKLGYAGKHLEAAAALAPGMLWSREFLNSYAMARASELLAGQADRSFVQDPPAALRQLTEAQARWEDTPGLAAKIQGARLQNAQGLWGKGRTQDALAELERVEDPSLGVHVSLLRARLHVARGELEAALQRAREAALMGKGEAQAEATELAGRILWAQRQPGAALAFLDTMRGASWARKGPPAAALERLRGEILFELGRFPEALEAAQAAQLAQPREAKNLLVRAHAERKLGFLADAADSFRERALLSPKDFEALQDAADAALDAAEALQARQPQEAWNWLHRARRASREMTALFPGRPAGWELLARCVWRVAEAGAGPCATQAHMESPARAAGD
jgi:spermidine synthase